MNFNDFYKLDNIVLNVSNACNRHCKYCYAFTKKGLMSNEIAQKAIDKCYKNHLECNSDKKFNISFYGGEPLLNWDCIKFCLDYCKEQNYDISFGITTNLTILSDEMIQYIKDFNIHMLISIDGRKETHDRNRDNSYDLVETNVKKLFENDLGEQLEARMTVMPIKCEELVKDIEHLISLGFKTISPVIVRDTIWEEKDYENLIKGLSDVWDLYFNKWNENNPVKIKLCDDYVDKDLFVGNKKQQKVCSAGDCHTCSIGIVGEIMPCHQRHLIDDRNYLLRIGYIDNDEIGAKQPFNYNLRKSKTYKCEYCQANVICKGGCPSENWTQNGDPNMMNATQCNIERIMFNVARNKIIELKYYKEKDLCEFLSKVFLNSKILMHLHDIIEENNPNIIETEFFGYYVKNGDIKKLLGLGLFLEENEDKIFPNTWATFNEVLEKYQLDK